MQRLGDGCSRFLAELQLTVHMDPQVSLHRGLGQLGASHVVHMVIVTATKVQGLALLAVEGKLPSF